MRPVLQSPIVALTAACISLPAGVTAVNFASPTEAQAQGCALHKVSTADVSLAAATSDLKLVFAPIKSLPGVGAAAADPGQKLEILALPKSLAADVETNGSSGLPSTTLDASRQAAANILDAAQRVSVLAATDPSPNNIVTRALQGAWNIALWLSASSKPGLPTGFDPATYASLATVASAMINVGILPFTVANLLAQGNFSGVGPAINTALTTLTTQLGELPTSIAQTVSWVLTGNPPAAATAAAASVESLQANQVSLAATDPSPNNIVTRALQGAWNFTFWLGASSKPGLPTGFDPATYASLATLTAAIVNVGVLPFTVANLVLQGNISGVGPAINSALGGLVTQATELPTSFIDTVRWVLTGTPPAAPLTAAAASVESLQANQVSLAATDPSPNNIVTRALQGAWNFSMWLGPSSKPGLPTGFDPATYASLATLTAAAVNVGVLPFTVANLVLQGNISGVAPAITTAVGGLGTQLTELPTSFVNTVGWVVTGNPPAAPAVKSTLFKASVDSNASEQGDLAKGETSGTENGGSTTVGGDTQNGGGTDNGDGKTKAGETENGGGTENGDGKTKAGGTDNGGGTTNGGGTDNGEGKTNGGGTDNGGSKSNGGGTTKGGTSTKSGSTTNGGGHTFGHKDGTKKGADKGNK